jgi:cell division protein FtsL
MPSPASQEDFNRQTQTARTKAVKKKKRSPFNVMLIMFGVAIAIVLYVGNVITVQQLLKDVSDEQARLQQILNEQEMLKAQINRMSSLERIRKMAEDDLGLHNPKGPPQWIQVNSKTIQEIQQVLPKHQPEQQKNIK